MRESQPSAAPYAAFLEGESYAIHNPQVSKWGTFYNLYLLTLGLLPLMRSALQVRLYGPPNRNAQIRNELMRKWAASRSPEAGGNVFYLDFDAMAEAPDAPPGLASSNWHFQCFLDPNHNQEARRELGSLKAAWHWPELPGHIYPSVWTDSEGKCDDEMNRNIWQMLFNILCNKRPKR